MRKFIKHFVHEYEDVSAMKKTGVKGPVVPFIDIIKENVFILVVILAISFLSGLYENLHFVLLVSNLYLVGSFLLYRVKYELLFKQINRLEYSTFVGITEDLLKFVIVLFTVHSVLYVFVLFSVVSIVLVIATISIAIVATLIYLRLMNLPKYTLEPFDIPQPLRVLWLSLLAIGFFYASGIESIILAYVTLIGIFLIMGAVYNAFRTQWIDHYGLRKIFTVILVAGIVASTLSIYTNKDVEFFNPMTYKQANSKESLEYELPTDVRDLSVGGYEASRDFTLRYSVVEGSLVLEFEEEINWLDEAFNQVKTIQKEENAEYFFIEDELYKSVLSDDQSGIEEETDANLKKSRYDLFLLEEGGTYRYSESVVYRDRLHQTRMIDFYWLEDALHYVERYDGLNAFNYLYLFDSNGKIIEDPMFDERDIVYRSEQDFLYTYSNDYDVYFRNTHNISGVYHDGQALYYSNRTMYIAALEDWINGISEEALKLEWDESNYIMVRNMNNHVEGYNLLAYNDPFDRSDRSIHVFNNEGKKVDSMPDVHDLLAFERETVIVNKKEETRRNESLTTYEFHRVPDNNLYRYAFKTQAPLLRVNTAFLLTLMVLNTNTLFVFKSSPNKKPNE